MTVRAPRIMLALVVLVLAVPRHTVAQNTFEQIGDCINHLVNEAGRPYTTSHRFRSTSAVCQRLPSWRGLKL